jgi:hypothetical protein
LPSGAKDAAQARRLLGIEAVLDGASREEAIGGMDRQSCDRRSHRISGVLELARHSLYMDGNN